MKPLPFTALKGASRCLVLLGILGAGCTTIPLQESSGTLAKPAADVEIDSLPPDALPPIDPVILDYESTRDDTTKPVTKSAMFHVKPSSNYANKKSLEIFYTRLFFHLDLG